DAAVSPAPASPRVRRPRRALAIVATAAASVVVISAGALYLERFALARWAAELWLRQRGVESLVTIKSLDLGHFSGALRLGDPHHPALTVERMDVDYSLTPLPGGWGVRTKAVRLTRPRLTARFAGGKLSFGVLQPIVDEALRRPAVGPSPKVLIRQGVITTLTDAGTIVFRGDAALGDGVLERLDGRVAAVNLAGADWTFASRGGPVHAVTSRGVLDAAAAR